MHLSLCMRVARKREWKPRRGCKGLPSQPPKAWKEDGDTRDLRGAHRRVPSHRVCSFFPQTRAPIPFWSLTPRREEDLPLSSVPQSQCTGERVSKGQLCRSPWTGQHSQQRTVKSKGRGSLDSPTELKQRPGMAQGAKERGLSLLMEGYSWAWMLVLRMVSSNTKICWRERLVNTELAGYKTHRMLNPWLVSLPMHKACAVAQAGNAHHGYQALPSQKQGRHRNPGPGPRRKHEGQIPSALQTLLSPRPLVSAAEPKEKEISLVYNLRIEGKLLIYRGPPTAWGMAGTGTDGKSEDLEKKDPSALGWLTLTWPSELIISRGPDSLFGPHFYANKRNSPHKGIWIQVMPLIHSCKKWNGRTKVANLVHQTLESPSLCEI